MPDLLRGQGYVADRALWAENESGGPRFYRHGTIGADCIEALAHAHSGRPLVSWELHGGVGYLDEQPPAAT